MKVNIEGEDAQADILLKKKISQEEKRGIADELVEEWGINENRIHIQTAKDEPAKWGIRLLLGILLAVAAMPVSDKKQKTTLH